MCVILSDKKKEDTTMKKILSAVLLLLLFAGCTEKKSVLYINNLDLCQAPIATLYLKEIDIKNSSKTFNIAPDEIRGALINSLKETNCFKVSPYNRNQSVTDDNEYILNAKVTLQQTEEVVEKNIFKKEKEELLSMAITLHASSDGRKVNAGSKSELLIDKSKILGFKNERDVAGDTKIVLQNATKKVSIALRDGFLKLPSSDN
jgi:hypothetical protein